MAGLAWVMRVPDHSTIAEFRRRHETEIAELFDQVLGLCKEAGLVSVGVITIDGTKIKATASMDQNRTYSGVAREILWEAEETDRREDELCGDARGDELPEQLRTPEGRREAFAEAKRRIEERKGHAVGGEESEREVEVEPARSVSGKGGRREWFRVRATSSRNIARAKGVRFRGIVRTGCLRPPGGLSRTIGCSWPPTKPTSTGVRPTATGSGAS
jgi:hypothetical protein